MTILIADDNFNMRQSIKRFLLKYLPNHHTILEAVSGEEAVSQYTSASPDWVLMDIKMKPMDGLTASVNILQGHPAAKIIILTSYDDAQYRSAAAQAGVWAYVLKDHMRDLIDVITKN